MAGFGKSQPCSCALGCGLGLGLPTSAHSGTPAEGAVAPTDISWQPSGMHKGTPVSASAF